MPKASKTTASENIEVEGYEGHLEHFDGGYTVAFETYTADADLGPYFEGLPDNQCQAAHWGYVIEGKVKYSYGDREEIFETGEAYYVPPGHTPIYAGTSSSSSVHRRAAADDGGRDQEHGGRGA